MSHTKKNHFISRFLTQPWEFKKGKVRIFRYSSKSFEEVDSATLFAKEKIFTQKQEEFFNKYVESIGRQELYNCEKNNFKSKKWKNYRALLFLIWDLVGRHRAAHEGDYSAVDFFTGLDEKGLDQYALAIEAKFSLVVVTIPETGRLFFPSNFIIYSFDSNIIGCNFGVAFDSRKLIMTVEKGADLGLLDNLAKSHFFVNQSVGNHATEFVLIHPDVPIDQKLSEILVEIRDRNQSQAIEIGKIRFIQNKIEVSQSSDKGVKARIRTTCALLFVQFIGKFGRNKGR